MKLFETKKIAIVTLLATILVGCNENSSTIHHTVTIAKTGYLVAPFDREIDYKCGEKMTQIGSDGMFQCSSFPITFYMDSKPIGKIVSLHNDGYVFPQDIIKNEGVPYRKIHVASR